MGPLAPGRADHAAASISKDSPDKERRIRSGRQGYYSTEESNAWASLQCAERRGITIPSELVQKHLEEFRRAGSIAEVVRARMRAAAGSHISRARILAVTQPL